MTDLTPPSPPEPRPGNGDAAAAPPPPPPPPARRPWVRKALIGFLVVANVGIFGALAAVWLAADKVAEAIPTVDGDLDLAATPGGGEPVTFLLVGSDSREGVPEDFTNMGNFGGQRADVIMLVKVLPDEGRVQILSLPRDLKITYEGRSQRINAAYNDGPAGLLEAVADVTPDPIHHYLQVNFAGFAGIVDAVGGIEMTFPYAARDVKSGFEISAGTHTLDGQQALQLARARKYEEFRNGSWGYVRADDIGRTGRQQDVLMALLTQLDRPGSIDEFGDLVDALGGFVQRDDALSADDIIQLGWAMRNVTAADIDATTLPVSYSSENGVAYVVQREPEATEALAAFRNGVPFAEAAVADAVVEVQNGSTIDGAAGATAAALEGAGFEISRTANADRSDYTTTLIVARPKAVEAAEAVAAALGYGEVSAGATPNGVDVVVIVGADAGT
ncbi:MAG: LCP family protein [Actinobacteria bacterium]|nr:LCP family protein [Actinomycetota bacterium]